MFSDVHTDFILNPLTEVLADGVHACTSLPVGIENSALGEYFMQSLFLRMTGAQEQKMKCIDSALAEKRTQMPKRLKDVLQSLATDAAPNSEGDDDNTLDDGSRRTRGTTTADCRRCRRA